MTLKEKLENCRKAYEKGATLIELTHPDGAKSAIRNPRAIAVTMDALKNELDRQLGELG